MVLANNRIIGLLVMLVAVESAGNCIGFEGFAIGQSFSNGQQLPADGVAIAIDDYYNGEGYFFDNAQIIGSSPHAGNALQLSNATARITTGCASRVRLYYFNGGGGLNIAINGDFEFIKDLQSAFLIGDTAVSVIANGNSGVIEFEAQSGSIASIRIGGQEFVIDHICIQACSTPDCFQFDGLDDRGVAVGDHYSENGNEMEILPFGSKPFGIIGTDRNMANHAGNEMHLSGATARFAPGCAGGVRFYYSQAETGAVIGINGNQQPVASLDALNGQTLGGVSIHVESGEVILSGLIESLEIGGNSLFIDNLCFAACPRNCIDFEELPAQSRFKAKDTFSEDGVVLEVSDYEGSAQVIIETAGRAGHTGHDAALSTAMLSFGFGCAEQITLHFGQYAPGVLIRHSNGALAVESLLEMDGVELGGVLIEVAATGVGTLLLGTLKLTGDIAEFSIAGIELVIDHVCHVPCTNRACVDFEEFPFGKVYREHDVMTEDFTPIRVQRFSGSATLSTATISGSQHAGGTGNEIILRNAQLQFSYVCAATVSIRYAIPPGGLPGVRLGVNGSALQIKNSTALDGEPLGGALISVSGTAQAGIIHISGPAIRAVVVGGNDLAVDQICHTECSASGTCAQFENLPAAATYNADQSDYFESSGMVSSPLVSILMRRLLSKMAISK